MKFIFLDIDGVLNSDEYFNSSSYELFYKEKKLKGDKENLPAFVINCLELLDFDKIILLNNILYKTKAELVIISAWRSDTLENLNLIFKNAGLFYTIKYKLPIFSHFETRGEEIQDFIKNYKKYYNINEKIEKYIIVDDSNDFMEEQLPYFVKIDNKVGLDNNSYEKIIKLLNE